MTYLTVIDLFAGCGGMTAGFTAAGFTPVLAVEHDPHAAATYAANFGAEHVRVADIAEVSVRDAPPAHVVIGGPPCQGFSSLGKRDARDPRNRLWREYLRFVRRVRPEVFVIENVAAFLSSCELALLMDEARVGGALEGYVLTREVVCAVSYGVPQRRNRGFVIGSRVGTIEMPAATHGPGLVPCRTVRDAIGDLTDLPTAEALPDVWHTAFGHPERGPIASRDLHLSRRPTETSLARYAAIPPGGGRFDLPDHLLPQCWRDKKSGTTDVMGRMHWDRSSLTIRTEFYKPEKGRYLHPSLDRAITHREAARLQSFPDDFVWCGSKAQIARQIGNAVPPLLAEAIARRVRGAL